MKISAPSYYGFGCESVTEIKTKHGNVIVTGRLCISWERKIHLRKSKILKMAQQ